MFALMCGSDKTAQGDSETYWRVPGDVLVRFHTLLPSVLKSDKSKLSESFEIRRSRGTSVSYLDAITETTSLPDFEGALQIPPWRRKETEEQNSKNTSSLDGASCPKVLGRMPKLEFVFIDNILLM